MHFHRPESRFLWKTSFKFKGLKVVCTCVSRTWKYQCYPITYQLRKARAVNLLDPRAPEPMQQILIGFSRFWNPSSWRQQKVYVPSQLWRRYCILLQLFLKIKHFPLNTCNIRNYASCWYWYLGRNFI